MSFEQDHSPTTMLQLQWLWGNKGVHLLNFYDFDSQICVWLWISINILNPWHEILQYLPHLRYFFARLRFFVDVMSGCYGVVRVLYVVAKVFWVILRWWQVAAYWQKRQHQSLYDILATRCRWIYFFCWNRKDLEKFSNTSLAHKLIICTEWVPSE